MSGKTVGRLKRSVFEVLGVKSGPEFNAVLKELKKRYKEGKIK